MRDLIWVGPRQSDVDFDNDLIKLSITNWGNNKQNNVAYYNGGYHSKGISKTRFIIEQLEHPKINECKIMFYNPLTAHRIIKQAPQIAERVVSLCNNEIIGILNNKIQTRIWMSKHVNTPKFVTLSKKECQINYLKSLFTNTKEFIVQEKYSSGGTGTYLFTENSEKYVLSQMNDNEQYLISENIAPSASVNTHILISKNDVVVFPASLQLISCRNNKFIYSGADFIAYKNLDFKYQQSIYNNSKKIGNLLRENGYLGICGIDFVIKDDEVYLIEINPRFQASTVLLNLALKQAGHSSMQQLQLDIYNNVSLEKEILENLEVNYSYYKFANELYDDIDKYNYQLNLMEGAKEKYKILYDGYDKVNIYDNKHVFGVVFQENISSFSENNLMHVHPNLELDNFISKILPLEYSKEKMISLKIALLNQGLRIEKEALHKFSELGGYNKSVFSSIDITINKVRMNTPINTKLSSISPFSLAYEKEFILKYCDTQISTVDVELTKSIEDLKTKSNEAFNKIAFISGDRLRIKPEKGCYYKAIKQGCAFCPNNTSAKTKKSSNYNMSDVYEVINYCYKNETFRHVLIGGGTANPKDNSERIINTIMYLSSISSKPIYLMCIPPENPELIKKYVEAGVNEIAFNVELFDRKIAKKYMSGKGSISLEHYVTSLKYATTLLGTSGNVRSMLIVGLESIDNTLAAVNLLCRNGVQPMLSIFRPTANCSLSHLIQPSNSELLQLYNEAQKICETYNLTLGPSCPSCQNNTLAITLF
jgi:predicted ATP-grasp superfamily ATP-dependent carboligase